MLFAVYFLLFSFYGFSQNYYENSRANWLQKAEIYKPELVITEKKPLNIVEILPDEYAFQGFEVRNLNPIDLLYDLPFRQQKQVVIDFGEHITGHFSFSVRTTGKAADAPLRLKFTFGEVPAEVAVSFDDYKEGLSRAWLQEETVTVMYVPQTITIQRRLAFRYVKIELLGSSPQYDFNICDLYCTAQTSAKHMPEELPDNINPVLREIDRVGLNTLKECMQTVFEDGPKRDQRLWIGDLYLQSLGNIYSYKQFDLTKRCLYLLAAMSHANGYLLATIIEKPIPRAQEGQFLFEYALLFNVCLNDYMEAAGDIETAEELWPVAKRQLDIIRTYVRADGLMDFEKANREWWIFFDWKEDLYREVALQGFSIFALNESYKLAKRLGKENEVADLPELAAKMKRAAHTFFYNRESGFFAGTSNQQISYASQIWMIISGVATTGEGQKALTLLPSAANVCLPATPYMYHYYIQALIDCKMYRQAKEALVSYWGGMVRKGADTFWEAYDPENDFISPYGFYPMNSYCHAWSCTPVYFIRKYPEIFQ
ncbi:MAG: glycoside hydrolase [Prevotellaceae bacterium]|nr:glycoside hydrolase [Prevotellaceae bacterium]